MDLCADLYGLADYAVLSQELVSGTGLDYDGWMKPLAEILYEDEKGNVRFVIPARINGLKMYLLGNYTADGETEVLGATQGYDESGFAIRGFLPLEAGMTVHPLFTAMAADGSEREYEGDEITVPARGLELTWDRIPDGNYLYSFGLTDLSGKIHYTDPVEISF